MEKQSHSEEPGHWNGEQTIDDVADELLLQEVFARRDAIEDGIERVAMLIYHLRAKWIGDMCLPWGLLTDGQRDGYKAEVSALIKKAKGE